METEEQIISLSVLKMTISVYQMAGVLSEGEALRVALVLKDSTGRLLKKKKTEEMRPAPAEVTGP